MNDYFEVSFEGFGFRELSLAGELLTDIGDNGYRNLDLGEFVKIGFNANSGNVFLTDDDGNVVMYNDDHKLENFLICGNCGHEDFKSKMQLDVDIDGHCSDCTVIPKE